MEIVIFFILYRVATMKIHNQQALLTKIQTEITIEVIVYSVYAVINFIHRCFLAYSHFSWISRTITSLLYLGHENSPVILRHHPHAKHLQVLKQSSSATSSSSRSSIASSSSLGMSSSSLNAPPFSSSSSTNSSSPRSSPTNWSGPVGTQFSDALYPFQHGSRRTRNSPVRSSSSSSADTVKSAGTLRCDNVFLAFFIWS